MQKSHGLTALELINPNQRIGEWLRGLAGRQIISPEALREASAHFKISRSFADWQLFLRRFFILMGVLLLAAGLIFFMAWNWEDLSRFAKFAALEAAFLICALYSLLRWNSGPQGATGWDARIALLGAAILIGGLLALYGQVYQTGADAWELFRAWTLMLLLIALPGRATAFWFLAWLVGSAWLILYLLAVLPNIFDESEIVLPLACAQFLLLALNESAACLAARRGLEHDSGRWLSRSIGCSAILSMGVYGILLALRQWGGGYYGDPALGWGLGLLLYLASLGLTFAVYYRRLPELVFLALSIFSAAAFVGTSLIASLLEQAWRDLGAFLPIGLIILGCAFGALKLLLVLRKNIRARALAENAAGQETGRSLSSLFQLRGQEQRKNALRGWLLAQGAARPEALEAYFADDEAEREKREPWYARVFVSIGVWLGSGALLAFFTFSILEGLIDAPQPLGLIGLIFCALSLQLGAGQGLAWRAFSQVLGVCGLIYAGLLMDFELRPTLFLLGLLLGVFWALKPPYASRLAAFLGLLFCLSWFLSADLSSPHWYLKAFLCWLGLLWAAHYLLLLRGQPSARWREIRLNGWLKARFQPEEALSSSALGCLIFFAVTALLMQSGQHDTRMLWLDFHLAVSAAAASLTALLCWRYPAARPLALPLGLALSVLAWFAPVLALGLGLVFLAFQCGQAAFLGAAALYLGLAHWTYYYSLQLSLLHKALVLMAAGLGLLLLGLALRPLAEQLKGLGKSS